MPGGGPSVVIHIVGSVPAIQPLFPPGREWLRACPGGGPGVVVHVVAPPTGVHLQLPALGQGLLLFGAVL